MPARSTEFQRLVYLVKKMLAGSAIVTESKFLPHRTTGELREVDICIESTTAGHEVVMSIECMDHTRPADVSWVEKMKGKHEHLPTKLLILASRSGYTDQARRLAEFESFQLLQYQHLTEDALRSTFAGLRPSLSGMTYRLKATNVVAVMKGPDGSTINVKLVTDQKIVLDAGEQRPGYTALRVVTSFLHSPLVAKVLMKEGASDVHESFALAWPEPRSAAGYRIGLEEDQTDTFVPIQQLTIHGTCEISTCKFPLQAATLGNVSVAWGTADLGGKDAMLVAIGPPDSGNPNVTLDLRTKSTDIVK